MQWLWSTLAAVGAVLVLSGFVLAVGLVWSLSNWFARPESAGHGVGKTRFYGVQYLSSVKPVGDPDASDRPAREAEPHRTHGARHAATPADTRLKLAA